MGAAHHAGTWTCRTHSELARVATGQGLTSPATTAATCRGCFSTASVTSFASSLLDNTVRVLVDGASTLMTSMDVSTGDRFDRVYRGRGDTPYSLSTSGNELILVGCNVQAFLLAAADDKSIMHHRLHLLLPSQHINQQNLHLEAGTIWRQRQLLLRHQLLPGAHLPVHEHACMVDDHHNRRDPCNEGQEFVACGHADRGGRMVRPAADKLARDFQHHRSGLRSELHVPIILQWEVVQGLPGRPADAKSQHPTMTTCPAEVASGLCKSKHSDCKRGRGYLCQCSSDYHGNPYDKDGCKGDRKSFNTGIYIIMGVAIGTPSYFCSSFQRKLNTGRHKC